MADWAKAWKWLNRGRSIECSPKCLIRLDAETDTLEIYKEGEWVATDVRVEWMRRTDWYALSTYQDMCNSVKSACSITSRLSEFWFLEDGWLDGRGVALSFDGLRWLDRAFLRGFDFGMPHPHLYPTEDGGVRAEWTIGKQEISLDINLEHRAAQWHRVHTDSGAEDSEPLNLDASDDWDRLVDLVADAVKRADI